VGLNLASHKSLIGKGVKAMPGSISSPNPILRAYNTLDIFAHNIAIKRYYNI